MRSKWLVLAIIVGIVGGVAVYRTQPESPTPSPQGLGTAEFGNVSLNIEFATSTLARERGLGGRMSLARDYGMLFVFEKADRHGFWMKDTLVPLDIFWLDAKGQVVHVEADVATSTYPAVFYPTVPALYVLETAAGFALEHRIAIGTTLHLQSFPSVSK